MGGVAPAGDRVEIGETRWIDPAAASSLVSCGSGAHLSWHHRLRTRAAFSGPRQRGSRARTGRGRVLGACSTAGPSRRDAYRFCRLVNRITDGEEAQRSRRVAPRRARGTVETLLAYVKGSYGSSRGWTPRPQ